VGPERQVAGAIPGRTGDIKQQSDLAAATRLRVRDTTGRCLYLDSAPPPTGAGEWQFAIVAAASRQHAEGDRRAKRGWSPLGRPSRDPTGGDRHRAGPGRHPLCPELQPGSGLWRLAISIISAVLRRSADRLLFRHRIVDRTCFRGGRRGDRRFVGLGEARLGRRLRQHQRQPLEQHQCEPRASYLKPVQGKRCGQPACELRPRAQRTGRTTRTVPSVGSRQRGAASDPPR